jgi:hypothetical protein
MCVFLRRPSDPLVEVVEIWEWRLLFGAGYSFEIAERRGLAALDPGDPERSRRSLVDAAFTCSPGE